MTSQDDEWGKGREGRKEGKGKRSVIDMYLNQGVH